MNKRFLERLASLVETAGELEAKVLVHGRHLDPLDLARALVNIDKLAKKLADVSDSLQPGLFDTDEEESV